MRSCCFLQRAAHKLFKDTWRTGGGDGHRSNRTPGPHPGPVRHNSSVIILTGNWRSQGPLPNLQHFLWTMTGVQEEETASQDGPQDFVIPQNQLVSCQGTAWCQSCAISSIMIHVNIMKHSCYIHPSFLVVSCACAMTANVVLHGRGLSTIFFNSNEKQSEPKYTASSLLFALYAKSDLHLPCSGSLSD